MSERVEPTIKLLRPDHDLELAADDVWHILQTVDRDFVPPLSARVNTTDNALTAESLWGGPITYFDTLMKQFVLLAYLNDKAVGLTSFIPHWHEAILDRWSPSIYVSTTAVLPRYRRRGIARALHAAVEGLPEEFQAPFITRRMWSTNYENIRLLESLGYKEVVRLPNHRGKGIDTIYMVRSTDPTVPLPE